MEDLIIKDILTEQTFKELKIVLSKNSNLELFLKVKFKHWFSCVPRFFRASALMLLSDGIFMAFRLCRLSWDANVNVRKLFSERSSFLRAGKFCELRYSEISVNSFLLRSKVTSSEYLELGNAESLLPLRFRNSRRSKDE